MENEIVNEPVVVNEPEPVDEPATSPEITLEFYDALKEVAVGKKICKKSWDNPGWYGFMNEGRLTLHKPAGTLHDWIVTDGDMDGDDWVVIK